MNEERIFVSLSKCPCRRSIDESINTSDVTMAQKFSETNFSLSYGRREDLCDYVLRIRARLSSFEELQLLPGGCVSQ